MTKKIELAKVIKIKETYAFTKNDITIFVRIDYRNNKISLMDKNGMNYSPKFWLFKDRGVEFMQGWLNILDVMKAAVTDAKYRYEMDLANNNKLFDEKLDKFLNVIKKK